MVKLIKQAPGFQVFKVKGSNQDYEVNLLDGDYLCECAILNKRNIKIECKHIKQVKQWLENQN